MRFISAKTLGKKTCSENILVDVSFEGTISCLESNTYATAEFFWSYAILAFTINSRNRPELITAVIMCNN